MWIYIGKILEGNIAKKFIFIDSNTNMEKIVTKQSIHKFCTDNEVVNLRVDRDKTLSGKNMTLSIIPSYKQFPDGSIRQVSGTSKEQVINLCLPYINSKLAKENNRQDRAKHDKLLYLVSKLKCINDMLDFSLQMKDYTNVMDILNGISRYIRQLDIDNAEYKLEDIIRKYGVPGIVRAIDDRLDRLNKRARENNLHNESLQMLNINNTIDGLISILRDKNKQLKNKHGLTKEIIKGNKEQEKQLENSIDTISEDEDTSDMIAISNDVSEGIDIIPEDEDTSDMIEIDTEYDMTYIEYIDTMNKLVKEYKERFNKESVNLIVHDYLGDHKRTIFLSWFRAKADGLDTIKIRFESGSIEERPEPIKFIELIWQKEIDEINNRIIQKNMEYKKLLVSDMHKYETKISELSSKIECDEIHICREIFKDLKEELCDYYMDCVDRSDILIRYDEYDKSGLFALNLLMLIEKQLTQELEDTYLREYDYTTILCNKHLDYSNTISLDNLELGCEYGDSVFREVLEKYDGKLPECFQTIVDRACEHFISDNCLNGKAFARDKYIGDDAESEWIHIICRYIDSIKDTAQSFNTTDYNMKSLSSSDEREIMQYENEIEKCKKRLAEMERYGLNLTIAEYTSKQLQ